MPDLRPPYLFVAPLTPFRSDLTVDYEKLRQEIEYVLRTSPGATISVAAVETQEYQYLSHQERLELIEATIRAVDGRAPTFVGVTHPNVQTAVELARQAESLGATGIQALIPLRPFGGPPSLADVLAYFGMLSEATSLPLCVYHNPGPGADLPPSSMVELAKLPKVQFFKESSRDLRRVGLLIEQIETRGLAHYLTTMEMLASSLCLGGSGATMPPPASALAARIVAAYCDGDLQEMWRLQAAFQLFPSTWLAKGLAPVMKAAMRAVGLDLGGPFPPFQGLTDGELEEVGRHLKAYGLC